jgi:hypothetical protein
MDDKLMFNNYLLILKSCVEVYVHGTLESSNDDIRKLLKSGLDDIMRKLRELGYLDERFNNELYLYEEEARRLLAKRLCAISYRDDIKLLMEEGIIKPETLTYNLNV